MDILFYFFFFGEIFLNFIAIMDGNDGMDSKMTTMEDCFGLRGNGNAAMTTRTVTVGVMIVKPMVMMKILIVKVMAMMTMMVIMQTMGTVTRAIMNIMMTTEW